MNVVLKAIISGAVGAGVTYAFGGKGIPRLIATTTTLASGYFDALTTQLETQTFHPNDTWRQRMAKCSSSFKGLGISVGSVILLNHIFPPVTPLKICGLTFGQQVVGSLPDKAFGYKFDCKDQYRLIMALNAFALVIFGSSAGGVGPLGKAITGHVLGSTISSIAGCGFALYSKMSWGT